MKTEEYSNAIVHLLMTHWKESKVEIKRDISNNEIATSLINQVKEFYEITGNNNDCVLCSDIYALFVDKKKITLELSNYNIHKKKSTKGEYKDKWCFFCIRKKNIII
jgi:hypothetical protein